MGVVLHRLLHLRLAKPRQASTPAALLPCPNDIRPHLRQRHAGHPTHLLFLRFPRLKRLALNELLGIHPLPTLSNAHIVPAFLWLCSGSFDAYAQLL